MGDTNYLPDLPTIQQIADKYDLHVETVRRWVKSGELVAFKLSKHYHVLPEDWLAFIRARRDAAVTDLSAIDDREDFFEED